MDYKTGDRKRIDAFDVVFAANVTYSMGSPENQHLYSWLDSYHHNALCIQRIISYEYFCYIARRDPDNLGKMMVVGKVDGK